MDAAKTLIIIPALNEADNILSVIHDLTVNGGVDKRDIIVVDDGSTDCMTQILRAEGVPYLSFVHNLGIGAAVQAGYQYAKHEGYDIAVQFDGDGQHPAEAVRALTEPIIKGEADYTVGSRFVAGEGFQSSVTRRMGIGFLSTLIRLLTGVTIRDVTSGLRAVNRNLIELFARIYEQDYAEPIALVYGARNHARIREVPVRMRERLCGRSSITLFRSVYYMAKVSIALVLTGRGGRLMKGRDIC